jgi:hypothetical protein
LEFDEDFLRHSQDRVIWGALTVLGKFDATVTTRPKRWWNRWVRRRSDDEVFRLEQAKRDRIAL